MVKQEKLILSVLNQVLVGVSQLCGIPNDLNLGARRRQMGRDGLLKESSRVSDVLPVLVHGTTLLAFKTVCKTVEHLIGAVRGPDRRTLAREAVYNRPVSK